ncbi:MAG: hypothetical protein JWO57_2476 [Pseudonocardiales bacterium]|nr:hypothetical protein [Pseudonocardiales bacterium]
MVALFNVSTGVTLEASATLSAEVRKQLAGHETLSVLGKHDAPAEPENYVYQESAGPRGTMLESLTLRKEAQSLMKRLFSSRSRIYVLSWAWHIDKNDPIMMVPQPGTKEIMFKLRADESRRFLGDGLPIFPPRPVRGGIGLNVQVWESKQKVRERGETLIDINRAIKTSNLYDALAVAAAAATATPAMLAFGPLAASLVDSVGAILRGRGDEYLDVFAGFYGTNYSWGQQEKFTGTGVEVALNLTSG